MKLTISRGDYLTLRIMLALFVAAPLVSPFWHAWAWAKGDPLIWLNGGSPSQAGSGEAASPAAAANSSNVHNVTFTVTSNTATKADVTITSLDAKGNIQQQQENGVALPYTKTIEIDASVIFDASNANILAQVKDGEDITASVQIDDNKPSTSTSTGEYATVVASASS